MSPTVTLDYGLRWEYDQPFYDIDDKIVNIDFIWDNSRAPVFVRTGTGDPYEGNPPFSLAPDIQYVRDGRFGRGAYKRDFNDIAPRLGVAWSVTPKTVVRGGGGIYYVRDIGNAVFDTVRNAPFTIRSSEPAETFRPNLSFDQPFARTGCSDVHPRGAVRRAFVVHRAVVAWIPARAAGRDVGRSDVLRIGRRASSPPADLQPDHAEPAGEHQPLAPVSEFGRHPGHERAKPFELPRALLEGAKAVLSRPQLSELVLYGKSIDNGSGIRTTDGDSLTPSNDYDLGLETGLSAFDFRKRWTTSWIWELPVGRDRRFMNHGGVGISSWADGNWAGS